MLIVAPNDVSTGEMAPDGAVVMAYRSNVPAIAEFTFQHRDPGFVRRAKEWGGGFIVAGDNYGQGSSREHAALAPLQLGVRGRLRPVVRPHPPPQPDRPGHPALPVFADRADYDAAELGQTWVVDGVRAALSTGRASLRARVEATGREFDVLADFSDHERAILLDGGLLRHLREGGKTLSHQQIESGAAER